MDHQDVYKTTFITHQGLSQIMVMPRGLCNAPTMFERLMELLLKDLNWKACLIYLYDIIICGAEFYPTLDRLKLVWFLLTVAARMMNLTHQGVDLVWDDSCEGAFQTLKAALVSVPALAYPTRGGHFVLSKTLVIYGWVLF